LKSNKMDFWIGGNLEQSINKKIKKIKW